MSIQSDMIVKGMANIMLEDIKIENTGIVSKAVEQQLSTYLYTVPKLLVKFKMIRDNMDNETKAVRWIEKEFARVKRR